MNDSRKEYIIQCVISVLNIPRGCFRSNSASNSALETFLDDSSQKVLQALEVNDEKSNSKQEDGKEKKRTVTLTLGFNESYFGESRDLNEMHFVKVSLEDITPANIHSCLLVSSLRQNLVRSLSHILKNIYVPCLNDPRRSNANDRLDGTLADSLIDLDVGIRAQLRRGLLLSNNGPFGAPGAGAAGTSGTGNKFESKNILEEVSGILVPADEVRFWLDWRNFIARGGQATQSQGATNTKDLDKVANTVNRFAEILNTITSELEDLSEKSLSEKKTFAQLIESMDTILTVCDQLWREDGNTQQVQGVGAGMHQGAQAAKILPYPQTRMRHFLLITGGAIGRCLQQRLSSMNVWTGTQQFNLISKYIREAIKVCEKWNENLLDYTGTDWKNLQMSPHIWEGEALKDEFISNLASRIGQVAEIRNQHDQILKLVVGGDAAGGASAQDGKIFESFNKVSTFTLNEYTLPLWNNAVEEYEKKMLPIETVVAEKLRKELFPHVGGGGAYGAGATAGSGVNPSQSIRVYQRYSSILERKNIKSALTNEREKLLAEIADFLERAKVEFEELNNIIGAGGAGGGAAGMDDDFVSSDNTRMLPCGRSLSLAARKALWLEQLRAKTENMLKALVSAFLSDLQNCVRVLGVCKKLRQDLKDGKVRCFKEWQDQTSYLIENNSIELSGKVMEFDAQKKGALKITYPEKLLCLIKEVRIFDQMGFNVPKNIRGQVEQGLKFYRYAIQLKQICNFHNHLGAELLPCQKLLVLNAAVRFEKLFSDSGAGGSGGISRMQWDSTDRLEEFTFRLKDGANQLRTLNRELVSSHASICEIVLGMAGISLLKQRDQWKQKIVAINKIIQQTTTHCEISDPKELDIATKPWRAHWDFQIFKVMEGQYRLGLESLNEALTEIRADLVFQHKECRLKPPLEEIKNTYFREIKNFIQLPISFKGLDGNVLIYKTMPERNPESLQNVFLKAENLFERIQKVQDQEMDEYLVFGKHLDHLEELVEKNFKETKDWEVNLKFVKTKKKEVERIPDSIKLDCVNLSTVVFKSAIDDQLDRFTDYMLIRLRKLVQTESKTLLEFLEKSLEKLNVKPDSVSELGQAQSEATKLIERQPELQKQLADLEEKNRLMKSVFSGSNYSAQANTNDLLGEIHDRYDEFEVRLQTFETLAAELREELLSKMEDRLRGMNVEIERFSSKWQALKPKISNEEITLQKARECAEEMNSWQEQWGVVKESIDGLLSDCNDFGLPKPNLIGYQETERDLNRQQASWSLFGEFIQEVDELSNQLWIEFRPRLYTIVDMCIKWESILRDRMAGNKTAGGAKAAAKIDKDQDGNDKPIPPEIDPAVVAILAGQIRKIRDAHPILKSITGEAYEREHWKILFGLLHLGSDVSVNTVTTAHFMNKLELMLKHETEIKELSARALGEVTIREALMEITSWFELTQFEFSFHTDANQVQVPLIKEWKDLLSAVSDKQALCNSLKDSRWFASFRDQTQSYSEKLGLLDVVLLIMNKVQRKWVYLEPIFARGALPKERDRFERVNREFRTQMKNCFQAKKVHFVCTVRGITEQFQGLQDALERCQKALNTFLEEKRNFFPRLYFLGDDDLLEILGQSTNPEVIQTHLKKLFAGIHSVEFKDTKNVSAVQILAMKSILGETVELTKPICVREFDDPDASAANNPPRPVEQWLSELSIEMVKTLAFNLEKCRSEQGMDLGKYPSQILNLSGELLFTQLCERAIGERQIHQLRTKLGADLQALTQIKSQKSGPLEQAKLKSLILDVIHQISIVQELQESNVSGISDWNWYKQLRFSLVPNSLLEKYKGDPVASKNTNGLSDIRMTTEVCMLEARQSYSFEYQGNAPRLVHTPLTDKAYLTMMHGMLLGHGGNPYGPAGTGKTESVKALGSTLGRQVLVFNCDEGIDFQGMARIFVGLVRCGAWGCFDEFNRLLEEQMSAISQLIQVIQHGIKYKESKIQLLNREIDLNHNAGIFITLNPAVRGYGGRQKLPDNLKQLFRPVAMSIPDNEIISEVELYSEGYVNAKTLAKKIVSLFVLSKQLLSSQQHYDWGLRALKTVLTLAGKSLFEAKRKMSSDGQISESDEALILLQSTRMNTLSKLTYADARRFEELCKDVFPGVKVKDSEYAKLEADIRESLKELKMNIIESQITKMLQLHEMSGQRMGLGIVGPSGCGKSMIWHVLSHAYKRGKWKTIDTHVMNPKAMPRKQLLGYMNLDTREWFDGVLTVSARNVVKNSNHSWVILDGDIDPQWVESLNSVLDDNRLLTLPNGERIQFGTNVNFIFETHSLEFASPATISRMGMIFLSEEDVDVRRLVKSWILDKPESLHSKLETWFDQIFYKALSLIYGQNAIMSEEPADDDGGERKEKAFQRQNAQEGNTGPIVKLEVDTTMMGMVRNVLGNMPFKIDSVTNKIGEITKAQFILAVINGFGCNLNHVSRCEFVRQVLDYCGERVPDANDPLNVTVDPADPERIVRYTPEEDPGGNLSNPGSGTSFTANSSFGNLSWEAVQSGQMVVPTVSVSRDIGLFYTWLEDEQPIVIQGPEGSGKNMLLKEAVKKVGSTKSLSLNVAVIHCNGQTTSAHLLQKLRQFCAIVNGAQGKVYRPKSTRRLILYLKDINLPKPDQYDTSQIIAFLQQVVMYRGFYDEDLEFVTLENIQLVCSMAPSSILGRHHVSTRFTANVRVCSIFYPSTMELQDITSATLSAVLFNTRPQFLLDQSGNVSEGEVGQISRSMGGAMVELYSQLRERFTVDSHEHYVFSPRDLILWVNQLIRYIGIGNNSQLDEPMQQRNQLFDAWVNEAKHIFRDRLVEDDCRTFDDLLSSVAYQGFGISFNGVYNRYTSLLTRIGGSNFAVPTGEMMRIQNPEDYRKLIEQGLVTFERETRALGIEIFDEVLENCAKIDRIISSPQKNDAFLIGKSGVGRRSLVLLMSSMQSMTLFSPCLSKQYGKKEWARDLKHVLHQTGIEKQDTVFFLEDHHFVEQHMAETVNSLLSAGEIPGLYTAEELEPLLNPLKDEFAQREDESCRTLFEYYVKECRRHLRIVLSMDPTHSHFLPLCASNPALFKDCVVVWLDEWSPASQEFVCNAYMNQFLSDVDISGKKAKQDSNPENAGKQKVVNSIVPALSKFAMQVHSSQSKFGATPRHLVTLLQCCHKIYDEKISSNSGKKEHLEKGLLKLQEVHQTVETLQEDAAVKQITLTEKQLQAQQALEKIKRAMTRAAERKAEVEQLEKLTQKDEAVNLEEKKIIEEELSQIKPILDAAKKAVGNIKQDHLTEIRSLKMPPEAIHDVLQGVLRIMGNYDASWGSMKKFLTGAGMISRIVNFDARQITPEIRKDVERLVNEKSSSYDPQVIYRVSVAAAPLAKWVVASIRYSAVLEKIAPMESRLQAATQNLSGVQGRLMECRQQLADIDREVAELQDEFETRTREAQVLQMDLDQAQKTLVKAKSLMDKLSGEKERWSQQVHEIKKNARQLPVHSVLAAAACSYLGHFSEDIREECKQRWLSDMEGAEFSFLRFMATESQLLTWKAEGLPADQLSQENGVIIQSSVQVPFIVDPNSQAIAWLEQILTGEIALAQDPKVITRLELAVRFGKTFIIKECEGIPGVLFPVLRKEFTKQGPRQVVQVGERACDFNETFKLYLCTRNSNAIEQLPPNASCLVTRVNFSITRAGLEGQLLGLTLAHEKPELESRKSELLQKEEGLKVQLSDLETKLLEQLADSSGNFLENEGLIRSLEETKKSANTISEALDESTRLQKDLDDQRESYRPLATLGSRLFVLLREFHCIDHMYRFSLGFFTQIFSQVLDSQPGNIHNIEHKIQELQQTLKVEVLFAVSRSIFKKDRLTFGVHMVHGIYGNQSHQQGQQRQQDLVFFQENEYPFFMGSYLPQLRSLQACNWCPDERREALNNLRSAFPRADDSWALLNDGIWSQWLQTDKCESNFPSGARMTEFQKILIIQAVRPDRLETALQKFACELLGVSSLSPPAVSMAKLHEEISSKVDNNGNVVCTPVLFVTTPGSDPCAELEEYSSEYLREVNERLQENFLFKPLAMGGGQNEEAIELLLQCAKHGDWICLKNLHLVISWIPLLEKELKNLQNIHKNFRCWLTTEAHLKFPPILLETSLKVTYEAPPGLKKNLLRTFESWTPQWFSTGSTTSAAGSGGMMVGNNNTMQGGGMGGGPMSSLAQPPDGGVLRSQILFLCAHFHAILQERRTYIPQGWTKFYEFSSGDLASACETVILLLNRQQALNTPQGINWTTLHGVLDRAVYGSRVDNDFDLRLVREYLSVIFRMDVLNSDAARGFGGVGGGKLEIPPFPIPRSNQLMDYKLCIEKMSDIDNPACFGMAANVDRSLQRINSQKVITDLRQLKTVAASGADAAAGGGGGSSGIITNLKIWEEQISPLWRFWESTRLQKMRIRPTHPNDPPVTNFILLDATEANRVVTVVSQDLSLIKKVVSGTGLSTPDLQATATSLTRHQVPDSWSPDFCDSSPLKFLQELARRFGQLKSVYLPKIQQPAQDFLAGGICSVRLADFLRPAVFLNALRQQTARKLQVAMDQLVLQSTFQGFPNSTNVKMQGPQAGLPVNLEGLLLEGASFDRHSGLLLEAARQSNLMSALPTITVSWCTAANVEQDVSGLAGKTLDVEIPVYVAINREKLLCSLKVATDNPRQRILNSTAMFLED